MSPLTLRRIKKANGQVRIVKSGVESSPSAVEWKVQVLEEGAWQTVYTDYNRTLCEQLISKARGQIILG